MEKTLKAVKSSELYRKIDALALSASDRSEVMGALAASERVFELGASVLNLLGLVSAAFKPNPRFNHQ